MKRFLCLFLLLILLLCACANKDQVTFYYCPANYLNSQTGTLLLPEIRSVTGYTEDPQFLIALYLTGPLEQDLVSPCPTGTKLKNLLQNENQLTIQLSDLPQSISDSEFSLACAAMTMTCLEFTGAESVTILSGDRSITMDRTMLTLSDNPTATQTTEGATS